MNLTIYTAETQFIPVNREQPAKETMAYAGEIIRAGGLVAFPTETVYGLGANALDEAAVAHIFSAKQRPANDPMIVHIHEMAQLDRVAFEIPDLAYQLAEQFWAGALTLVLKKHPDIPQIVTAGNDTVAVRMPNHPVALALLREADVPIAAPSANRFSRPSPTSAAHVMADLAGHVDLVLDGGTTDIGIESTILDLTSSVPTILRPGGVSVEDLRQVLPTVAFRPRYLPETIDNAPSPGMLLKHYSPRAEVRVYQGDADLVYARMHRVVVEENAVGQQIGMMLPDDVAKQFDDLPVQIALLGTELATSANLLFAAIRDLDAQNVDVILVRMPEETGLGLAIRDRLLRAAEGRVIEVSE